MQIAYGYRIDMVCDHRTPVITMLDVHPDRAGDRVTLDCHRSRRSPLAKRWTRR